MNCEIEELRREVQSFCQAKLPFWLSEKVRQNRWLEKADYDLYMRLLHASNLLIGHWPLKYGGRGWSPLQRLVFEEETGKAGAPWLVPMGIGHVGPVIYAFGSELQKEMFLPPIRSAEVWWTQCYSEPGAGSDLASLKTRAVRQGEHYILSGRKIWTSFAHWADWGYCLARTSQGIRPQEGISFLLVNMKSPGVSVRPIITMDMFHHLNEVVFENVSVPVTNLIGKEGEGWKYAKYLLVNERMMVAEIGRYQRQLNQLLDLTAPEVGDSGNLSTTALGWRVCELDLRLFALRAISRQALSTEGLKPESATVASMMKLKGSVLQQDLAEALIDSLGLASIAYDPISLMDGQKRSGLGNWQAAGLVRDHLYSRAASIFGGSSEIQRNIIAKAILGF